jgi:hypothetical protein
LGLKRPALGTLDHNFSFNVAGSGAAAPGTAIKKPAVGAAADGAKRPRVLVEGSGAGGGAATATAGVSRTLTTGASTGSGSVPGRASFIKLSTSSSTGAAGKPVSVAAGPPGAAAAAQAAARPWQSQALTSSFTAVRPAAPAGRP